MSPRGYNKNLFYKLFFKKIEVNLDRLDTVDVIPPYTFPPLYELSIRWKGRKP